MKSLAAWLAGCACAFASACALTTGVAAQTIKAPALPGVRNIVLVHGAFTD